MAPLAQALSRWTLADITTLIEANRRVLISGAGIAGLTLAYWLQPYRNFIIPPAGRRCRTLSDNLG